ncbi:MAG: hypothetical protein R3A13_09225 [Bdellovibrionota bacterium]
MDVGSVGSAAAGGAPEAKGLEERAKADRKEEVAASSSSSDAASVDISNEARAAAAESKASAEA